MTGLFGDQSGFDPDAEGPSAQDLARFGEGMTRCEECGVMMYSDADVCPECGAFQMRMSVGRHVSTRRLWSPGVILIVTIIALAAFVLVFVL